MPPATARRVQVGPLALAADIALPAAPRGLVVFAHGSGTARHSPRNRSAAQALNRQGFATLLFDLLAPDEATRRGKTFDLALLARRLADALDWIDAQPALAALPLGLLGAGTGAAAALAVSARRPGRVDAIVSRSGWSELDGACLQDVQCPTLLIVGEQDAVGLAQNRSALARLPGAARLDVVNNAADPLVDEAGHVARSAGLSAAWFSAHLPAAAPEAIAA